MPDLTMAKLIRMWLMIAKQEGVEAKLAARAQRDSTDNKGDDSDPKKAGKIGAPVKEDRAKSPIGKKQPLPPAGVKPVENSRPASGDMDLKRKNKLRDRVAGKTEKLQSIGNCLWH
jgi:hypothetical protein